VRLPTVPQVCFKQNIHGRSLADISAMATAWEAAPPNYTLATADSLFKEEGARCRSIWAWKVHCDSLFACLWGVTSIPACVGSDMHACEDVPGCVQPLAHASRYVLPAAAGCVNVLATAIIAAPFLPASR
jgi:hypothetical protein